MSAEDCEVSPEISLKPVRFSEFEFHPARGELSCDGQVVKLRPRAACALSLLISRAGDIVSHEDLRAALWGETIVEWQDGLHHIIRELRQALGDNAQQPSYIETINRRGYRFRARIGRQGLLFQAKIRRPGFGAREVLIFGGGAACLPALVLLICVAIGLAGGTGSP